MVAYMVVLCHGDGTMGVCINTSFFRYGHKSLSCVLMVQLQLGFCLCITYNLSVCLSVCMTVCTGTSSHHCIGKIFS